MRRARVRPCGWSWLPHPALCGSPTPYRWRRRLLLGEHPVQLAEIAALQAAAQHVGRNLTCALRIKLVSRRELKLSIGASQRSLKTSTEKALRLDHDHASGAAIRVTVGQPEEGHRVSAALPATVATPHAIRFAITLQDLACDVMSARQSSGRTLTAGEAVQGWGTVEARRRSHRDGEGCRGIQGAGHEADGNAAGPEDGGACI